MKIKTEKGDFNIQFDTGNDKFTSELYAKLEDRLIEGANLFGIKELANIAIAVRAVKSNTGSLDNYLINVVDTI